MFEVFIHASPYLDILGMKFDSKLSSEDHVLGIVSRASQRIGILRLVKPVFVDWYLRFFAVIMNFVLPICVYCSPVWG